MNVNDAIERAAKLANQGKFAEADKICRDIIKANDKFHPAYHLLGSLAFQAGRDDIATQMLHKASLLDANRASYHRDLAEVLALSGKPKDAMMVINRALSLNGNDAKSHYIAGLALMALNIPEKAVEAYKAAIKLAPNYGAAYNNLGAMLEMSGKADQAKDAYTKAILINENHAEAHNNLAALLIAEGSIKEAETHLNAAISARPNYIEAHHNLSALKKYHGDDAHIPMLKTILKDADRLPLENKARLYFTLAKVYSDLDDHDLAFDYYKLGNDTKRASIDYQEERSIKISEDIISTFDNNGSEALGNQDPTPIFIVGMPRSGSTLLEQILSGHSDIFAAGELLTLGNLIKEKLDHFPAGLENLSDQALKAIGDEYLAQIKELNPGAARIVDKMPGNYQYAGLIARILPNAHIINARRDPMDCCFSIYTRLFLETLHYTYDLAELGRYYKRYQTLMDHWHHVLPDGIMIDVAYEDVVENVEEEARKLIKFIGLDWQDECLNFHKNKAPIKTASAAQVRKPIYKTSIEKWRPYEKHLEKLMEALG